MSSKKKTVHRGFILPRHIITERKTSRGLTTKRETKKEDGDLERGKLR